MTRLRRWPLMIPWLHPALRMSWGHGGVLDSALDRPLLGESILGVALSDRPTDRPTGGRDRPWGPICADNSHRTGKKQVWKLRALTSREKGVVVLTEWVASRSDSLATMCLPRYLRYLQ